MSIPLTKIWAPGGFGLSFLYFSVSGTFVNTYAINDLNKPLWALFVYLKNEKKPHQEQWDFCPRRPRSLPTRTSWVGLSLGDNGRTGGTGRAADRHLLFHLPSSVAVLPCRTSWGDRDAQCLHSPLGHLWPVSSYTVTSVTEKQSL